MYRALDLFVDLGLVVSAATAEGETVYEIARPEPHHHLLCRGCGREQEIDHNTVAQLFAVVEQRHGFHTDMDHLVLVGLCAECQRREET